MNSFYENGIYKIYQKMKKPIIARAMHPAATAIKISGPMILAKISFMIKIPGF